MLQLSNHIESPYFNNKKKILIVDDVRSTTILMEKLLAQYDCTVAFSGKEALLKANKIRPDLILLDVMMPDMDGFEVCAQIRAHPKLNYIPIIMVTALGDRQSKLRGLEVGVNEFLTKPIDAGELFIRVSNILKIKEYNDFLADYNMILCQRLDEKTRDLEEAYQEMIERLTVSVEFRNNELASHVKRISYYTKHIATLLGYKDIDGLAVASQMHDIGKIGIPDNILLKEGKLTFEEFEVMKTHTIIGGKILGNSRSPFLQLAKIVALQHHERWDGSGYPFALKGNDISLEGCIVNLADQYDALRMSRPYKPAFPHEKTFRIIAKGDGRTMPEHFSPVILEAFMDSHTIFDEIFETYQD